MESLLAARGVLSRLIPVLILGGMLSACGAGSGETAAAADSAPAASVPSSGPATIVAQAPTVSPDPVVTPPVVSTPAPAAPVSTAVPAAPTPVVPVVPPVSTPVVPPTAPPVVTPVNVAPVISGTPASSVIALQTYSFRPTASDANGGALGFAITNKPAWATFSTVNGQLSGTPGSASVGSYAGIVISVSDGKASVSLPAFTVQVQAPANGAPTISGSPALTVASGAAYSFQPTASDPNGDALTFAVSNKPAWAAFDTVTGRLSGAPTAAQVGSYANITITVSDGKTATALSAFSINVTQTSNGVANLSWVPPMQNTDGSALTIGGYRIYYGTSQAAMTQQITVSPGLTTYAIQNLSAGTYYFGITAYNSVGLESQMSGVGSKTIM